jgi:HlyD family secretion protein
MPTPGWRRLHGVMKPGRWASGLLVGGLLTACGTKPDAPPMVTTVAVDRRTIVVDAQATGAVEPINVIEVKSKASGQITRMPVETGSQVKVGDLLVQIDTRDVKNQYDQAAADLRSAEAGIAVAQAQKQRSDELFKSRVITTQEYEAAQLALTQAQGAMVRATTNVDLAKQRLEDATVVAPVNGTIIDKPVSLGQVIASATGSVSGGTTLLKMADLTKVRVRALVNETDIGKVRPGQSTRVTVDAYPERPFQGVVEKIEPQAVVQQSVTMFPVIVSLDNRDGLLKPGMNGEVSMLIERRTNVLAVSNDAVRTVREAAVAATFVGLNPDSVTAQVRTLQGAMRTPGGSTDREPPAGDTPSVKSVPRRTTAAGTAAGGTAGAPTAMAATPGGRPSNGNATRVRTALVFVEEAPGKFSPRLVRLGASDYDYSEVISGLTEGEKVATLAVQALQAKRDQQNDRFRSMTGAGGMPGATPTSTPAAGTGSSGRPPGGR